MHSQEVIESGQRFREVVATESHTEVIPRMVVNAGREQEHAVTLDELSGYILDRLGAEQTGKADRACLRPDSGDSSGPFFKEAVKKRQICVDDLQTPLQEAVGLDGLRIWPNRIWCGICGHDFKHENLPRLFSAYSRFRGPMPADTV